MNLAPSPNYQIRASLKINIGASILLVLFLALMAMPLSATAQTSGRGENIPCPGGTCRAVNVRGRWVDGAQPLGAYWPRLDGAGRGGNRFSGNQGQQDTQEEAKVDPCKNQAGNPINFSTGNKVEYETDFSTNGEAPLYLERTYNHYWKGIGIFGRHWVSNVDFILTFDDNLTTASCYPKPGSANCSTIPSQPTTIWSHRPDGRQIKFIWDATANAWLESKAEAVSKVVKNADGTYTLISESGNIETYSGYGRVLNIKDVAGIGWAFTYSASNYLTQVTHTSGRSMQFTWTGNQLTRVTDPAGSFYNYTYLSNRFGTGQHLLASSQFPGAPTTTISYHYEDSRYLGGLTGKSINGVRYSTFAYDGGKRAILSKHAGNVDSYSFAYTTVGSGRISTANVTNPLGLQTTYSFVSGKVINVTGAASQYCQGAYKERTYDEFGYEDLVTDFESNITDYDYNAKGQLLKKTDAAGTPIAVVTDFEWDSLRNRITKETVQAVSETTTGYTADNLVAFVSVKNLSTVGIPGNVRTTTFTYTRHPNNMLASVTQDGPLPGSSDAITTQFSSTGDLISVSDSLGVSTSYQTYNALGLPGRITYRGGAYQEFVYDARGRVTQKTQNNGNGIQTQNYIYDGAGNLVTRSNAEKSESYEYVAGNHRLASIVHANNSDGFNSETIKTGLSYNANGNVTERKSTRTTVQESFEDGVRPIITVDQLYSSYTDYDELGRVRAQRGNAGQNFRATYDREDRLKTSIDSFGHTTTNTYNALSQLISSTDANGGITIFEYNKAGNITKVTDPRNLSTIYQYDGLGQLWSQNSPDAGVTAFTYDAYGLLTGQNKNGSVSTFSHDAKGRLTAMSGTNAQGTVNTHSYSYDWCGNGTGRLCGIDNGNGTWMHYGYTASGQVSVQRQFVQNADDWIHFEYDGFNRLTKITYPNGEYVTYNHGGGNVTGINAGVGANKSLQIIASNFAYHPATELLASFSSGLNGQARMYNYDADTRLTSIQAPGVQGLSYSYNANNEITGINNSQAAAATQSYAYDSLSRVVTANNGDSTGQSFVYDGVGNRISHTQNGQTTTLNYEATSNRLISSSKPGLNRSWIYSNTGNSNGFTGADGVAVGLSYDAFDRINGSSRNGQTTYYTVNAIGQRIAKNGPNGTSRFIYGPDGSLLAENNNGIWTNYIRLNGEVIAMLKNGSTHYVYNDHLGRPEVVRNSPATNASTVWAAKNTAFDRSITQNTLGEFNLGFPGQYFDSETGTWYNYFRDYDASTGRYVQSDPIGLNGGLNTYSYARSNAVRFTDRLGLAAQVVAPLVVAKCVAGAAGGYMTVDGFKAAKQDFDALRAARKKAKEKSDCEHAKNGTVSSGTTNPAMVEAQGLVEDAVTAFGGQGASFYATVGTAGAGAAVGLAPCTLVGAVVGFFHGDGSATRAVEGWMNSATDWLGGN